MINLALIACDALAKTNIARRLSGPPSWSAHGPANIMCINTPRKYMWDDVLIHFPGIFFFNVTLRVTNATVPGKSKNPIAECS